MLEELLADDDDAAGGEVANANEIDACDGKIEGDGAYIVVLGGEEATDGVIEVDSVAGCALDDYPPDALVYFGVEELDVINAIEVDVEGVVEVDSVVDIVVDYCCVMNIVVYVSINSVMNIVVYKECIVNVVIDICCIMNVNSVIQQRHGCIK